jgi:hypothetical protein
MIAQVAWKQRLDGTTGSRTASGSMATPVSWKQCLDGGDAVEAGGGFDDRAVHPATSPRWVRRWTRTATGSMTPQVTRKHRPDGFDGDEAERRVR